MDAFNLFQEWKRKHGEVKHINLDGIEFYFRLITRDEYRTLKNLESNDFIVDDMIAQLCVLEPIVDDWGGEIYAGYTNTIARVILEESLIIPRPNAGDKYVENLVNKEYELINNSFERQMPPIIIKAFPAYKLDEIKSWPLSKQIETYASAIWMLNEIDSYGISFSDEEE